MIVFFQRTFINFLSFNKDCRTNLYNFTEIKHTAILDKNMGRNILKTIIFKYFNYAQPYINHYLL
jgi:hypothetical protein